MLGATAAGLYPALTDAMLAMAGDVSVTLPRPETATFHDRKYRIFREMAGDQLKYRDLLAAG
jgi:ribulose kinase